MNEDVQRRLAKSLTGDNTDIIPFLPYLLQDFWCLGSDPDMMAALLRQHTDFGANHRALDLACGKGAVSIVLAKVFGCRTRGVDLLPEFVAAAQEKAREHGVADLCEFAVGDVNETVAAERGWDLAVWGAAGDLLGGYAATLSGIAATVRPGGYILLDDAFLPEEGGALRFHHDYLTRASWRELFVQNALAEVACLTGDGDEGPGEYAEDLANIRRRAGELAARHPGKRQLFEDYAKGQQGEYEDLQDGLSGALWLLRKAE